MKLRTTPRLAAAGVLAVLTGALTGADEVTVDIGSVPPGKTVTIRFQVAVPSPVPAGVEQVSNQGTLSGGNFSDVLTDDPGVGGASDPTVTPVAAAPDLVVSKGNTTPVFPGATVTYEISVTNVGDQVAGSVTVSEAVPASTTFDAGASAPTLWSCVGSDCTTNIGSVAPGANPLANFGVVVDNPLPNGTQIENTVSVADASGEEATPADNTFTDTDGIGPRTDLSLTKSDARTVAFRGRHVTYTITVRNLGPEAVTGARVVDTPSASLMNVTWTCKKGTGGTCPNPAGGSGALDAFIDLTATGSVSFTFDGVVRSSAASPLVNTASVSVPGGSDLEPGNNSATDTDTVISVGRTADANGDGHSDLVLFNAKTRAVLQWHLDGTGAVSGTRMAGTQSNVRARIVGMGDYDGNGVSDLLWQDPATNAAFLWLNDSSSNAADLFQGDLVVGSGDYDGDGTSDVLRQQGSVLSVSVMSAGEIAGTEVLGTVPAGFEVVGSGDHDADGQSDVLLHNPKTGQVQVWRVGGSPPTVLESATVGIFGNRRARVLGIGDFDGDGPADAVWVGGASPTFWMLNGVRLVRQRPSRLGRPRAVEIVGSADYDEDGRSDLAWQSRTSSKVDLWLMNGNTVTRRAVLGRPPSGFVVVRTK
jgi:uncharacterized repeat protein (TIGR01451 family)